MLSSVLLVCLGAASQDASPRYSTHAALLASSWTNARMLDPEREQWAVAIVKGVSAGTPRELEVHGRTESIPTFNVDLEVIDGWNVRTGPLRTFWWEQSSSRQQVIGRMVGGRALARFAPVVDGHHVLVSSANFPVFRAREGEPFISVLLPFPGTRLESGPPELRAWKSLWRAGLALDASAYPDFDRYMDGSELPLTPPERPKEVRDRMGNVVEDEGPGLADAQWLFRLAGEGTPEYRLVIAEYLRRDRIKGALKLKRDLVLLSLRDPSAFPNGFSRGAYLSGLCPHDDTAWIPIPRVVDAIVRTPHPLLATDLLELLIHERLFVADRAELLPRLASQNRTLRDQTLRAFTLWHGKPPEGEDAMTWHRSRSKLGMKELQAAKASMGG